MLETKGIILRPNPCKRISKITIRFLTYNKMEHLALNIMNHYQLLLHYLTLTIIELELGQVKNNTTVAITLHPTAIKLA